MNDANSPRRDGSSAMTQADYAVILQQIKDAKLEASQNMTCQFMASLTLYMESMVPGNRTTRAAMHELLHRFEIDVSETLPVPSGSGGGPCCRATSTRTNGGKPSTPSSTRSLAAGGWQRGEPIGVLAILLRSGADRIETEAPAMRAHASTMLVAADELEHLAACVQGAFKSLEISQARLETLAEPDE